VKEFLDRIGAEVRQVMRAYAESEMKIAAANRDLPLGALPVDSGQNEHRSEAGLASSRTLRGEAYCAPWSASTSRTRSGIPRAHSESGTWSSARGRRDVEKRKFDCA
jgi:hypothetical protein